MNLLVCEFITGGGLQGEPLPDSLAAEGELMLQTLLRDLASCTGIKVACLRDSRLADLNNGVETVRLSADVELIKWIKNNIQQYDSAVIIAPESGGVLYRLVKQIEQLGVMHLGSRAEQIALCTDKRATLKTLGQAGISVAEEIDWEHPTAYCGSGWIVKPRDGAGSENTYWCESGTALQEQMQTLDRSKTIIQPYIEGPVASLSLFCVERQAWLLAINQQLIEYVEGRPLLRAVHVNHLASRYEACWSLAQRIYEQLPGLQGYVGVDFILASEGPVVLEVNPRLTSSYAGLAESTGLNLAALLLDPESLGQTPLDHRLRRDAVLIHL